MSSATSGQHLAAILPSKAAGTLKVGHRPTPTPGPNDLLVEVKAVALNPVDYYQRDHGYPPLDHYPTVIGSDVGGIVLSAGSSVPSDAPKPGTRIAAFATTFLTKGLPDYGAFQTRVLVPAANTVPLPSNMTFNEATLLPMAVMTAWSGLYTIDVPRDTAYTAADKKGILIWGGASSIGSAAVQVAKSMGFSSYVTASEKHHDYLKGLGASEVFDYKSEDAVGSIVKAAKADGVTVQVGFDAVGQVGSCLDVLKELKGGGTAKLGTAVPPPEDMPTAEGVEVRFVSAPGDTEARTEHFHFLFGVWLKEKLGKGEYVPSPKVQVVGAGLESINKGLDELKGGVSGVKLVVEF